MKDRKRSFKTFQYRECGAFAEYLRKQSQQGWHFKEWRFGLVFEKGEPEDIIYDVVVFPKGTEMDTHPEEDAEEYGAYCEAAGWKLVDGQKKFCIFRREKEDAVPIVTPEERLRNVWKAESRLLLGRIIVPIVLMIENWFQVLQLSAGNWLLSNLMTFMLFGITLIAEVYLLDGIRYIIWRIRAGQCLKNGKAVNYGKIFSVERLMGIVFLLGILVTAYIEHEIMFIITLAIVFGVLGLLSITVQVCRPSRGNNWGIQLGGGVGFIFLILVIMTAIISTKEGPENPKVNPEEVPLSQMAFVRGAGRISSAEGEKRESILAEEWSYSFEYVTKADEEKGIPSETQMITYQIYVGKYDWVTDLLWRSQNSTYSQRYQPRYEDCTEEWGAEKALGVGENLGIYKVKYPGKVVSLYTTPALTKEEIQQIRKMLLEFREG